MTQSSEAQSRSQDGQGPVRALSEQDELCSIARQRELETERDELLRWKAASAKSHAGMNAAVQAMETRQRELEE